MNETPPWATIRIKEAANKKSDTLYLIGSDRKEKISAIPSSVFNLSHLQKLFVSDNLITNIPGEISRLDQLQYLSLRGNRIVDLSSEMGALENLNFLDLSYNDLERLPESFDQLQNLSTLKLNGNLFRKIPRCISKLRNLTRLEMAINQLKDMPSEFTKLINLQFLDLGSNDFQSIPDAVYELSALERLFFCNYSFSSPGRGNKINRIGEISSKIINLKNLSELDLLGSLPNPVQVPPPEVLKNGTDAIMQYFRQIEADGIDYLYEAKLLLVGESGAGKTSLANKILDPRYKLREEESTKGIQVLRWNFLMENKKSFSVNIWDFGGQEIYHATHQFFLTKRSLYILVADARNQDTDFYYWLHVIDLLSESSPLMIVVNEKQDRHREVDEKQLRGEFINLKEILSTNLATNRGLEEVIDSLKHYIVHLPLVGSALPKTWVKVREALEKDPRNYISYYEFVEICKTNGFTSTENIKQLSGYLHDLGVFLHFQDEPLLNKSVILKPEWGTSAVYKILDNNVVKKKLGHFTKADLSVIWNDPQYIDMQDELLRLMRKFNLAYEIPDQPESYIAPQLLSNSQPPYEWDETNNLVFRYRYVFMPKGIMTQFIVSMHPYILQQLYVWKSGVILEMDETRAEVIEFYSKREIRIRISGRRKKELLTIIMHELDKIHGRYKTLKFNKLIPCNCTKCKNMQEPYFFSYDELQQYNDDGRKSIECRKSYANVNVMGLIDDIMKGSENQPNDINSENQNSINYNNIVIEDGAIVESFILSNNIQDSFNQSYTDSTSEEIEKTLQELRAAVERMSKLLPQSEAEKAARDMDTLATEAKSTNPQNKWYQVSAEGLKKAAKNVGEVGGPVIELAGKIIGLLSPPKGG